MPTLVHLLECVESTFKLLNSPSRLRRREAQRLSIPNKDII